jgi:hypothetical protein
VLDSRLVDLTPTIVPSHFFLRVVRAYIQIAYRLATWLDLVPKICPDGQEQISSINHLGISRKSYFDAAGYGPIRLLKLTVVWFKKFQKVFPIPSFFILQSRILERKLDVSMFWSIAKIFRLAVPLGDVHSVYTAEVAGAAGLWRIFSLDSVKLAAFSANPSIRLKPGEVSEV